MSRLFESGEAYLNNGDFSNASRCFIEDIEQGNDDSIDTLFFIHKHNPNNSFTAAELEKAVMTLKKCVAKYQNKQPKTMIWLGVILMTGKYGAYTTTPDYELGNRLIEVGVDVICKKAHGDYDYKDLDPRVCIQLYEAYGLERKRGDINNRVKSLDSAIKYIEIVSEEHLGILLPGIDKGEILHNLRGERDELKEAVRLGNI